MAVRALITGSRTWVNAAVIRDALLSVWGDGDAVRKWSLPARC
jgi:hypothetical protein